MVFSPLLQAGLAKPAARPSGGRLRPRWGLGPLALLLLLLLPLAAWGQERSRTLEQVKVFAENGAETLLFTFSEPIQDYPQQEFRPGGFVLIFSATGSTPPRRSMAIKNSKTVSHVTITQTLYATEVDVTLRDAAQNMKDKISLSLDGSSLKLRLLPPAAVDEAASSLNPLGMAQESSFAASLLTMVLSLALVLGLFYLGARLYQKLFLQRMAARGQEVSLRHVASFSLGPRQRVTVMEIGGKRVALGVTPQQITFLTNLGDSGEDEPTPGASSSGPVDPAKEKALRFANTLKDKLGSMKKIR